MSTENTNSPENSLVNRQIKDTKNNGLEWLSKAIDESMSATSISSKNEFPVSVFPTIFRDLINDLSRSLNFPPDYTGIAVLVALSTIIGTTVKVKVKATWYEYPALYCCLIGNAGSNKTHPINIVFSPLKEVDKVNHNDFIARYKEFEEYKKMSKEERSSMKEVEEPKLTKSILTNFTPEVLDKRLNENPRGCTILSDEMPTFFELMNNYSKGDQIGNYLTFWSNQPRTIDRVGSPVPIYLDIPYLSIIGGLQVRMLSNAFPMKKLNNGFFSRFLFAYPDIVIKQSINDNESDPILFQKYADFIKGYYYNNVVSETESGLDSRVLTFTPEAKDFFYQWHKEYCALVNEHQKTIKGEIASKFDIHFVRLALLLQIMEDPKSTEIQLNAVKGAEKLCTYFLNCSFAALAVIQNPMRYLEALDENKKRFYINLPKEFKTAEAINIGSTCDIIERRVNDLLQDTILFQKIGHGFYKKLIPT